MSADKKTTVDQQQRLEMVISASKTATTRKQEQSGIAKLNQGIQLSAKAKALKIIHQTERREYRKNKIDETLCVPQIQPNLMLQSNTVFAQKGTLQDSIYYVQDTRSTMASKSVMEQPGQFFDDKTSEIGSEIFTDIAQNQQSYIDRLGRDKSLAAETAMAIYETLPRAQKIEMQDKEREIDDYAHSVMLARTSGKSYNEIGELVTQEPERDHLTVKAKIKLRVLKKFKEDEIRMHEIQDYYQQVMEERTGRGEQNYERLPSLKQRTRIHKPVVNRISFTSTQLNDTSNATSILVSPENNKIKLSDLDYLNRMREAARFPIPEPLLATPKKYWMYIDSIMKRMWEIHLLEESSERNIEQRAPDNSEISDEELSMGEFSESSSDGKLSDDEGKKLKISQKSDGKRKLDKSILHSQPFNIGMMGMSLFSLREGEVPYRLLLDPEIESMVKASEVLKKQQEKKPWNRETIQLIFDHYSKMFKSTIRDLIPFYVDRGPGKVSFVIKNQEITEVFAKAICATIPFMAEVLEVRIEFCNLDDVIGAMFIMASFLNPTVSRLGYVGNMGKLCVKNTLVQCVQVQPTKLREINMSHSIKAIEVCDNLCRSFVHWQELMKVNMAHLPFSLNSCRSFGWYMLRQRFLKDLDLSNCQISNQGTRYIIDALNRNTSILHCNFENNDCSSSIYEFSIKIAAFLTRHPNLLHLNLANCLFKREEVMFMAMAMSTSKTFLSLHLTGNELSYYDRVFLRSVICARVQTPTKINNKKGIQFNKDRSLVLQLAIRELFDSNIQKYLEEFQRLEENREGLDFELHELIKDMDMSEQYNTVPVEAKLADIKPGSKLEKLIKIMTSRSDDLNAQQGVIKQALTGKTGGGIKAKINKMLSASTLIEEAETLKTGSGKKKKKDEPAITFNDQARLKIERQLQRVEIEATKVQEERSAGELALLFMGINQVAFELLIENPMTGYMNEIIFARILGNDDIEQGNFWVDTTICYICQKWDKSVLHVDPRADTLKWVTKINQLGNYKEAIDQLSKQAIDIELVQTQGQMRSMIIDLQSEESQGEKTGGLRFARRKRRGFKKARKFKSMLDPSSDEGTPKHLDFEHVGEIAKMPLYGGTSGLQKATSRLIRKLSTRAENIEDRRAAVQTQVDGGIFSEAVNNAAPNQETRIERIDTPPRPCTPPGKMIFNSASPVCPIALDERQVHAIVFPSSFEKAKDFEEMALYDSPPETPPEERARNEITRKAHDEYIKAKLRSRYGGTITSSYEALPHVRAVRSLSSIESSQPTEKGAGGISIMAHAKRVMAERNDRPLSAETIQEAEVVLDIAPTENKIRRRGEPEIIKRTVFFQGLVYIIEEEIYSDSDNSSVYTSEDDFETDPDRMNNLLINTVFGYEKEKKQMEQDRIKNALLRPEMTDRQKRLLKAGITQKDETQIELTAAQKEYRTKMWPKHYIPSQREYKATKLDEVGGLLDINIGGVKHYKRTYVDLGPELSSGPLKDFNDLYIVCSANDWMPNRMKSKRELVFEKLNPDEPIPKATFVLDNITKIYADYFPPGFHFFYFVWNDGRIFLSPNYEICRFKMTNIFLNRVFVKPRIIDFDAVHVVKGVEDEEAIFLKDRSVFKDFKDDSKFHLRKCFDEDMGFSKMHRVLKSSAEEMQEVSDLLFKHYQKLLNIHLFYAGISSWPTISMNDFTSWSNKCNFVDGKNINLAALDRILITTNVALHGFTSSAERDLNRYEFLEIIVRLSIQLYREAKVVETSVEAVNKLIVENILPNSRYMDGDKFRRFHLYNVKVNEVLKKNEVVLQRLYDSFLHSKKKWITLDEAKEYIRHCETISVSEMMVGPIYAESLMTLQDNIRFRERCKEMRYAEFLVFLCRIAYEHYRNTPYHNELMYLKIDKMLPTFLFPNNLNQAFTFNDEFEYKPIKRARRVVKKKIVRRIESSETDESDDDESSDEQSSEEDLAECVILEQGKFQINAQFMERLLQERKERQERSAKRHEEKEKRHHEKKQLMKLV